MGDVPQRLTDGLPVYNGNSEAKGLKLGVLGVLVVVNSGDRKMGLQRKKSKREIKRNSWGWGKSPCRHLRRGSDSEAGEKSP